MCVLFNSYPGNRYRATANFEATKETFSITETVIIKKGQLLSCINDQTNEFEVRGRHYTIFLPGDCTHLLEKVES